MRWVAEDQQAPKLLAANLHMQEAPIQDQLRHAGSNEPRPYGRLLRMEALERRWGWLSCGIWLRCGGGVPWWW